LENLRFKAEESDSALAFKKSLFEFKLSNSKKSNFFELLLLLISFSILKSSEITCS